MRTHNKMSISTIQSLSPIRTQQAGVWGQLLTLTDGGKFAFYDPHDAALPYDLGVPDDVYPEVSRFVRSTVRSFKETELGPLQKPGFACLVTPPTATEVKIEADSEVLAFLQRKDPTLSEALLWGD